MRKSTILSVLLILLIFNTLYSQNLTRKGGLGAGVDNAPQSFFDRYGWATTKGVVLTQVIPGSSAELMGLKVGDVIVEVNGFVVGDVQSFYNGVAKLKPKESIRLKVLRRSASEMIIGELNSRFDESSPDGKVLYDEVQVDYGYLRSLVHRPEGEGKFPAIYYLPDYSCTSIDYSANNQNPIKQLIDGWVSAGYVVYRLERPGVGDSDGAKKCETISFEEEVSLYQRGLKQLKEYSFVDSTKVFLFGHSFGGVTAPVLASKAKVKGIMVYGATLKPWFEHLITAFRMKRVMSGEDPVKIEEEMRKLYPILIEWLINGKSAREIAANEPYKTFLLKSDNPLRYQGSTFMGRHSKYFYEVQQKSLTQIWKNINVPVLSMIGELDMDNQDSKDAEDIAKVISLHSSKGKGSFKYFPSTDRNFVSYQGGLQEYIKLAKAAGFSSEYTGSNFNKELLESTLQWLKEAQAIP